MKKLCSLFACLFVAFAFCFSMPVKNNVKADNTVYVQAGTEFVFHENVIDIIAEISGGEYGQYSFDGLTFDMKYTSFVNNCYQFNVNYYTDYQSIEYVYYTPGGIDEFDIYEVYYDGWYNDTDRYIIFTSDIVVEEIYMILSLLGTFFESEVVPDNSSVVDIISDTFIGVTGVMVDSVDTVVNNVFFDSEIGIYMRICLVVLGVAILLGVAKWFLNFIFRES